MQGHETLSKNFIGNIDSIKKDGRYYCIEGWIVPLLETNSCLLGCEGFESVSSIERPDIYSLYKEQHINFLRCGFRMLVLPQKETLIIKANDEDVFKLEVDLTEFIMNPNILSSIESVIVDDFYNDPVSIRNYALSLDYSENKERFNGLRSIKGYIPSWMSSVLEQFINKKFKEYINPSGTFLICSAKDQITYNFLNFDYMGLIGLNPDISEEIGISTFKSKITNLTHKAKVADAHRKCTTIEKLNTDSFNNNPYDKTNLLEVDKIMLKFNRLIILNARTIHSLSLTFGNQKENSLLFHYLCFNVLK